MRADTETLSVWRDGGRTHLPRGMGDSPARRQPFLALFNPNPSFPECGPCTSSPTIRTRLVCTHAHTFNTHAPVVRVALAPRPLHTRQSAHVVEGHETKYH